MSEAQPTSVSWPIVAGFVIVLVNAFFVVFEFALVTVRRGQIERMADEGNGRARVVARMLQDPDLAIAGSQVGITMASILLGVVAEEPLRNLLAPVLAKALGAVPLLSPLASVVATIMVFVLLSFVLMVIGEQVPKTVALRYPAQAILTVAGVMAVFSRIAKPLVWLVDQSTSVILRVLGVGGQTGGHGIHNVEELKEIVRESEDEGVISAGDEKLVLRAMEFGSRFVREAMIPRTDIVAIERRATLRELLQLFTTSRHSRFPVYEDSLDHICGVVSMKEALARAVEDPSLLERPLVDADLIQPAFVVPESRRIGPLFNEMRRDRVHMAIVLDEFGGTAGLVTAEELAEEVVGRLTDEWVDEPPAVNAVSGGAFEIDAQSRVDEVNEALRLALPTSADYETVAGFLLFLIRRIPRQGDQIAYEDLRFTVTQMTGRKIARVKVERV
jgi:CBS domain containing-hemolysin-like protein